ncbi:MAG: phosphatase PAP2 family protein [Bacteroidota bacterium]
MNDSHRPGHPGRIRRDFQQLWNDFISYYTLPLKWNAGTWRYAALCIILFPGLFFVDPYVRAVFAQIHSQFLDSIFSFAHWYGKPQLTLITFGILYLAGLAMSRQNLRIAGWKVFEAFAVSGITVTILKSLFGRWRPYTGHGSLSFVFFTVGPNDHLSLPSGDAGVAVAYSMIVASFSPNKFWKAFWYLCALLTDFGRIYHDQHWFSDVLLGTLISLSVGIYLRQSVPLWKTFLRE